MEYKIYPLYIMTDPKWTPEEVMKITKKRCICGKIPVQNMIINEHIVKCICGNPDCIEYIKLLYC